MNFFESSSVKIGNDSPCFIIAEAGVNHNGDLDLARELIDIAVESGADAVKFQTFKAELLNTKNAPKATYHIETTGNEQSWFDLLKSQELDRNAHIELIDHCNKRGILFLSTPYDYQSADLLKEMNVPMIKIASTDANNIPFLKYLAHMNIPLILSTGMCNYEEVKESVNTIVNEGQKQLALLQCTSNYPAPVDQINLKVMDTYRDDFNLVIGYSDHTQSEVLPIAAVARGAKIFEKHFTKSRSLPGPDHRSSLEPEELKSMIKQIRDTEIILGGNDKIVMPAEVENRQKLRKSVVAKANISKGGIFSEDNLDIKRPGSGLPPKHFTELLGKKVNCDILEDDLINMDMVE